MSDEPSAGSPSGTISPSLRSLLPIPGYTVSAELARGGMGIVYRARQHAPDRDVALKMLLPFSASSEELHERFQLEGRTLSELDHPVILPIYETGEHDGLPWFSMKLADGGSLADRASDFLGRWKNIAELIATLADAVQFAHERGVLHRDLKPANILFDSADRAFVADFGLAKLVRCDSDFTQSQRMMGTPHYLAPEVAASSARHATTASDVYGLGAILFELLAGRPPFEAEGLPALLKKIAEEELSSLEPWKRSTGEASSGCGVERITGLTVPRDLQVITLKCLAKNPAHRYASARELAEELRRFLAGVPIQARAVNSPERLWRWCCRKPALASALAACALILVAGICGILWQLRQTEAARAEAADKAKTEAAVRRRAEHSEQVMRENLYAADMLGAFRAVEQDDLGTARLLLEAHRPGPAQEDLRGFEWRYLWLRTQPQSIYTLRIRDRDVSTLELSPDATRLAVGGGPQLLVYDVASLQIVGQTRVGGTQSAAFAPDGRQLFIGSRARQDVRRWDFQPVEMPPRLFPAAGRWPNVTASPLGDLLAVGSGGDIDAKTEGLAAVYSKDGSLLHSLPESGRLVAFSPEGERLATGSWQGTIKLWRPRTGELLTVLTNAMRVVSLRFGPDGSKLVACSLPDGCWLFDLISGEQRAMARSHAGAVWDAAISPDGQMLATGGADQTVRLWSLDTGEQTTRLLGHSYSVSHVTWTPDSRKLITGGQDGTVRFWDVARQPTREQPSVGAVRPEFFSDDGRWLLSEGPDGSVDLLEYPALKRHSHAVRLGRPLRFRAGGGTLVTWEQPPGQSAKLVEWSVPDLLAVRTQAVSTTSERLALPTLAPNGHWLAAGTETGAIRLRELKEPGRNLTLQVTNNSGVLSLTFSPDSRVLAATFRDSTVLHLLDTETGNVFHRLPGHAAFIHLLVFSRHGDRLLSADGDKFVKLWDWRAGVELGTFKGHREGIIALDVSPDGKTLASSSADRTVRLWNLVTRREVARFEMESETYSITFAPDGNALFLTSRGGAPSIPHTAIWRALAFAEIDSTGSHTSGK